MLGLSAATILKLVTVFQERAPQFQFALDLTSYIARPDQEVPTGEWRTAKERKQADKGCVIGWVVALGK